jgi:4-hydroxybenzoate polyprenyltransferase
MSRLSPKSRSGLRTKLNLFFALSRTPHGLIDIATPALGALLWLNGFPPPGIIALGFITAFAGYTTIYALNDLLGWRSDRLKLETEPDLARANDLDAVGVRHPIAVGLLSFRAGLIWTLSWAGVAVVGAYLLNPFCVVFFAAGGLLEAIYCLLLNKSHLRSVISGAVKTMGSMAAVFAVDANPSVTYLILLFLSLFFWEIGGQNVPNDLSDIEEDKRIKAKTIPIRFGPERAIYIILVCLIITVTISTALFNFAGVAFSSPYMWIFWAVCIYMLLFPAVGLYQHKTPACAMALFNRASCFPLVLFILTTIRLVF